MKTFFHIVLFVSFILMPKAFAEELPTWPDKFNDYEKPSKAVNDRLDEAIEFFKSIYNESKNVFESESLVREPSEKSEDIAMFSDKERNVSYMFKFENDSTTPSMISRVVFSDTEQTEEDKSKGVDIYLRGKTINCVSRDETLTFTFDGQTLVMFGVKSSDTRADVCMWDQEGKISTFVDNMKKDETRVDAKAPYLDPKTQKPVEFGKYDLPTTTSIATEIESAINDFKEVSQKIADLNYPDGIKANSHIMGVEPKYPVYIEKTGSYNFSIEMNPDGSIDSSKKTSYKNSFFKTKNPEHSFTIRCHNDKEITTVTVITVVYPLFDYYKFLSLYYKHEDNEIMPALFESEITDGVNKYNIVVDWMYDGKIYKADVLKKYD